MPGIYHDVTINASTERTFEAATRPEDLNAWWTLECAGTPEIAATYKFYFGPDFDWHAEVCAVEAPKLIAWKFTMADQDWTGTELRMEFKALEGSTRVRFEHTGWQTRNDHFRRSSYCWAQYLRLFKSYLEHGASVPYRDRQAA